MRRLLAAIAAVVMVAGGFIVWQARSDSSTNDPGTNASGIQTIWCVPEAAAACNAANVPIVLEMTPVQIETAIVAARTRSALDTDAIVAPDFWLRRWSKVIPFTSETTLAQTAVVAVQKIDFSPDCKGQLTCLLRLEERLSLPSITNSSVGLLAGALALRAEAVTAPSDDSMTKSVRGVAAVKRSLLENDAATMLTNLLTLPLLDAAVMTRADVIKNDITNALITPVVPNGDLTLTIGTFQDAVPSTLTEGLTQALTTNGWSATEPGTPPAGLDEKFLNDSYEALR